MKSGIGTSLPELTLFFFIKKFFHDTESRYKHNTPSGKVETDIFIPSLKVAIEYDGSYYHKKKFDSDVKKNASLNAIGIYVIRVREKGLPSLDDFWGTEIQMDTDNPILDENFKFLSQVFSVLSSITNRSDLSVSLSPEVYRKEVEPKLYAMIYSSPVEPNLTDCCAINRWDDSRNYPLSPQNVPAKEWIPAILICPEGRDVMLPRYWREYKSACAEHSHVCEDCLFDIFCPFLRYCQKLDRQHPVQCDYMRNKVFDYAAKGICYRDKKGDAIFHGWLFNESYLSNDLMKEFLSEPPFSERRYNILSFFYLNVKSKRHISSTQFPAWTDEQIDVIKMFRLQPELKDIEIQIRDYRDDSCKKQVIML